MILFTDIYKKAIGLFDDPKITHAYNTNKIVFDKYMYGYLSTTSIREPIIIAQIMSDTIDPKGETEIFEADGITKDFEYTLDIPENSEIVFTENGKIVQAEIDVNNKIVHFPDVLPSGGTYSLEYYFAGAYIADFSHITSVEQSIKDITTKVTNILARLIIISWAEETRDMLVDIQGLLRDTDFKSTPNNQILKAKTDWVQTLQHRNDYDQNKLSWQLRYSSGQAKFKRF